MKNFRQYVIFFLFGVILFAPVLVVAAVPGTCPTGQDCSTGIPIPEPRFGIGGIVGCFLGSPSCQNTASGVILSFIDLILWIAGLLAVFFIIVGGVRYITAHGNEEQAEAAKGTLTHAVIGIVIVLLSFVIVRVISNALISGVA